MLHTSKGGLDFHWPDGSEFVEVYDKDADYADQPVFVLWAGDIRRQQSELNKLANDTCKTDANG